MSNNRSRDIHRQSKERNGREGEQNLEMMGKAKLIYIDLGMHYYYIEYY